MNIYVETNFVLELVFEQEFYDSCQQIVTLTEEGKINLILPAYCLAEPHEKLTRQAKNRKDLQDNLEKELRQLKRTASYNARINSIQNIQSLLLQSNEEEKERFGRYCHRLLDIAKIIPLSVDILKTASNYERLYGLSPQDAFVYASVMAHIQQNQSIQSCFLNKNSKDFDNPDITNELNSYNCRMIPKFDDGLRFVLVNLKP